MLQAPAPKQATRPQPLNFSTCLMRTRTASAMPHLRSSNVRPDDVKTYERNGVVKARADGFGISLGTEQHIERMNCHNSWLWKGYESYEH